MGEWRDACLGELVAAAGGSIRTGPFGSQLHADEYTDDPAGVPVVMPKDMVQGRVARGTVSRIDELTAERLKVHRLAPGDLVLARRGDVGRYAFIEEDEAGWLCGTGAMRVHAPDPMVIWPRFLEYAMAHRQVTDWLVGHAVGATMPNLNSAIVAQIPLSVPTVPTQRRIASVLAAFDDLIEINERRIELLEDLARSLYHEWFVRFRFPGHETATFVASELGTIPTGWAVARLGDVAELRYGKALPATTRRPGPHAVVSSAGVVGEHDEALVQGPGVVVGRKGNVGAVWWINDAFFPIDTAYYVETDAPLGLVYWQLRDLKFIDSHAAVPGLSREQAGSLLLLIPSRWLAEKFDAIHATCFGSIRELRAQNQVLAATRDLLLPRLVTGRLDISDVDLGDLLPAEAG